MKFRIFSTVLLSCLVAVKAFAFGHEGHQAIAAIAQRHLSEEAAAKVSEILGGGDLAGVATWLDDVRAAGRGRGEMKGEAEATDFVHRFKGSAKWHFVNMPVGSLRYDANSPYASQNDVVHAIALAVNTLEGKDTGLSQIEALKVLVHCVGDVHQPLHTVSGYYAIKGPTARLLSPGAADITQPSDGGGNALFYTKSEELHSLFDSGLLKYIVNSGDFNALAEKVTEDYGALHHRSAGDYHLWAAMWATESVKLGTQAYRGIELNEAQTSPGRAGPLRLHRISVRLPEGYKEAQAPMIGRQISEAGLRLAELLNSIQWAN